MAELELREDVLEVLEPTHTYNKVTKKLKHLRSKADIDVTITPPSNYTFIINGKMYQLAQK